MYKGTITVEAITESKSWNTHKCHAFVVRNQGNTNLTILKDITLKPGEFFSSGEARADIVYDFEISFSFDTVSTIVDPLIRPGHKPLADNSIRGTTAVNSAMIIKTFLQKI